MASAAHRNITRAVDRHRHLSKQGLLERAFIFAFRGLVYAQIWEDPEVDMDAPAITPDRHVVTIASGECNVLSPAKIKGFPVVGHGIAARDSSLRWDDGMTA